MNLWDLAWVLPVCALGIGILWLIGFAIKESIEGSPEAQAFVAIIGVIALIVLAVVGVVHGKVFN